MSKRNINLDSISDIKLRDDGNEAKLTLNGKNDQSFTVTFSFEQLQQLVSVAIALLPAARFNRGTHSDTPKNFNPFSRDVLLATDSEIFVNPDGSLDFVFQTRDNRSFQLSLLPEHRQALEQILAGRGNEHRLH